MTNDRAAEILKAIIFMLDKNYYSDEVEEAIHMAINALQAQDLNKQVTGKLNSADDTISRQAAIDALDKRFDSIPMEQTTEILQLRRDLRHLPSAQPEQQWIPCSERLPEPRKAVLGYAPRYQNIYALYYDSAYGWMIWNPLRDDCFPNSQGEIVAWMPLPEPYKAERRTDE